MAAFVLRRLAQAVPTVFLTTVLIFLFLHLVPGDPAAVLAGSDAPPEVVEALRKEMGLDRSLPVQYAIWIGRVARGDLGVSYVSKFPVWTLILRRLPATLELTIGALLVGMAIGLPAGIVAAMYRGGMPDLLVSSGNAVFLSVPNFWIGITFILAFALALNWLPPSGRVPVVENPLMALKFLLLPAFTLGMHIAAIVARFSRTALLEVLNEQFIRTARAKGLAEWVVILRHGFANALLPVLTIVGLQAGYLLGGAVVVESVFAWPGLGRLIVRAIFARDHILLQGAILVFSLAFVVVNLLVDLSYAAIDPRVGRQG